MIKVVLDTNVIVSAFNFPDSRPDKVFYLVSSGAVINFISEPLLKEVERVLARKFFWTTREAEAAGRLLQRLSRVVAPHEYLTVLADYPDNRVLECAIQSQADYIISGDKHLLNLKNYHRIEVVSPTAFLELINRIM